jgi:hypothetical protein
MKQTYSRAFSNVRRIANPRVIPPALLVTAGLGVVGCSTAQSIWTSEVSQVKSKCSGLKGGAFCECMYLTIDTWIKGMDFTSSSIVEHYNSMNTAANNKCVSAARQKQSGGLTDWGNYWNWS